MLINIQMFISCITTQCPDLFEYQAQYFHCHVEIYNLQFILP